MAKNNQAHQPNILILDSQNTIDDTLNIAVPDLTFKFRKVGTVEALFETLKTGEYHIVLLNLEKDGDQFVDTIKLIKQKYAAIEIIIIVGAKEDSIVTASIQAGARDCFIKPVSSPILLSKINHICELQNAKRELLNLRQHIAMNYTFDNFIGLSAKIQKIKRTIQHLYGDNSTIFLSGEDGTGKNLLARIIHYHSSRRNHPLVTLDCSTLTTSQIEDVLFGTSLAADESSEKSNLFERAAGSTFLIDKLHLMDLTLQAKLIKYLERLRVGVGTDSIPNSLKFRLLITVNAPLFELCSDGTIDKSFLEKLGAIEIFSPSLRERSEDIGLLAAYFLRMIAFEKDLDKLSISSDAIEILKSHRWPGNVRELESCLRRAAALCHNNHITGTDIGLIIGAQPNESLADIANRDSSKGSSLVESQRRLIAEALAANNWNFTQTAKQLGIGRTTLWRKVRKFDLKKDSSDRFDFKGVTTNGEQQ